MQSTVPSRGVEYRRPNVKDMTHIIVRTHKKYGSAIFEKDNTLVESAATSCINDIEILTVDLEKS